MGRSIKRYRRFFCVALALCLLVASLAGCAKRNSEQSADVLTQKRIQSGRKPVTVLVKYAFTINTFEQKVEERFPDIDLIQVGNYTRDMGIAEYESRLEHDDLPDLVMTWPLDVGEEYWEDRLLDLSGFSFSNSYQISMLDSISRDGKLYYLPGPSQVRGIVYNKTLFQEKGWDLPTNFDEFIALCKTIESTGMRSLQLGLGNSEVLDTAFVGYGYADSYSQPQDVQWIQDYNQGKGNFADHFTPALETFQELIDNKILQPNDLNVTYSDREKMLFTRQCAMVEDSVLMARMGHAMTGTTDEFALMPFFNPGDGGDWARLYMVCFVGMNKHLAEPKNKETYDLALKLMEYISTPEGQEALMGDTGAMFSSLVGVDPPSVPETAALLPAMSSGRCAIFPQLKNSQAALREGLAGMVRGELTAQEVGQMVDTQNLNPPVVEPPRVLGTATDDFSLMDTGSFVSDCMRAESGCEVALFLDNGKDGRFNGKGISGRFYKGDVTATDLARVMPDLKSGDTGTLWKGSITGADLLTALEQTLQVDNAAGGWFYYCSGLRMEYDVTAEPGSRILSIATDDGKPIDPQRVYTVAVMENSIQETLLQSCEKTDRTIFDLVQDAILAKQTISPANDERLLTTPTV